MKKILMCRPSKFDVNYVINPWMEGNIDTVDKDVALEQWQNLHEVLKAAGATVILTDEPPSNCPDAVFTANAGLAYSGRFITSRFMHRERQPEEPFFRHQAEKLGYSEVVIETPCKFEGAGDALFDCTGVLWTGWGFRSEPGFSTCIATELGVTVNTLKLVDPRWYHLDTAFCPLDNGGALWYPGAFDASSQAIVRETFKDKLVTVSESDALKFACNAISLGDVIILPLVSESLLLDLATCGYRALVVYMSQFLRSGGACKCLTLELT